MYCLLLIQPLKLCLCWPVKTFMLVIIPLLNSEWKLAEMDARIGPVASPELRAFLQFHFKGLDLRAWRDRHLRVLITSFPKYGVFCRKLHIHKEIEASVSLLMETCELHCWILFYFQFSHAATVQKLLDVWYGGCLALLWYWRGHYFIILIPCSSFLRCSYSRQAWF